LRRLFSAISFLSIIPLPFNVKEEDLKNSAGFFPLVGAIEGGFYLLIFFGGRKILGSEIIAGLMIAFHYIFTGAFHADGLSDTFDAIALRGERARKLAIMKDRTAGPAGVTAIAVTILLKYLFLEPVMGRWFTYIVIFLFPVAARWAMAAAMFRARPARQEGLGHMMVSNTGVGSFLLATVLLAIFWGGSFLFMKTLWLLPVFMGVYIFALLFALLCKWNFGGLTGDNAGAISELSEIIFLMLAPLCSRFFS
jgi:adenosylcobinamide-GDP ribazoletransferase